MKTRILKLFVTVLMVSMSENVWADGYTSYAIPTEIVTTGDEGITVAGLFGNHENCTMADKVIIRGNTTDLKFVKAMVLSALLTKQALRFYVIGCDSSFNGENLNWVYNSRYHSIRQ